MMTAASGSCLCKGVAFRVTGALAPILACHCSMCAKTSGNYVAMTSCATSDLDIHSGETLKWYRSSENVERGFCQRCGGNVFWKEDNSAEIYICAGTLDPPTGLAIKEHIFVGSKSDYYTISDDLPRKDEW